MIKANYKYIQRVPPQLEPVSLDDIKAYLKVDISEDDTLLDGMISAARQYCEKVTGRFLLAQEWSVFLDRWYDEIHLKRGPIISLDAINIYDDENQMVAFDVSNVIADLQIMPAELMLKRNSPLPHPLKPKNGLEIKVTAGYGENVNDVPKALIEGIKQLVGHWYEFRGLNISEIVKQSEVETLWRPYKLWGIN